MGSKVVIRLYNKKSSAGVFGDIRSIFCVPKAPARVYIEAPAHAPVQKLCDGMHFVYRSSIFSVPICERVALLTIEETKTALEVGDAVKIRNGLYKADIGEVVDTTWANERRVTVKLKSRQRLPYELKRKRGRTEPFLLDKERLERIRTIDGMQDPRDRILSYEEHGSRGFVLNGTHYTEGGLLLLDIRTDRVERVRRDDLVRPVPPSSEITEDMTTDQRFEIIPSHGDPVVITGGSCAGVRGFFVERTSLRSALISVDARYSYGRRAVVIEEEFRHILRVFEIGDRVEVKVGRFQGRTGVISAKVGDTKLHIVNPNDFTEVSSFPS